MKKTKFGIVIALMAAFTLNLQAQYFGKNKPSYESFDFKVLQSPHFEIYHYLENEEYLKYLANASEQWYHLHQNVLRDTFHHKNPLIFYNDHADFQQTNTIGSSIGIGTGGVTEAFKNRVIMPLAMSNQQTHHVLGHELVHAFQFHMIINGDSTSLRNMANLPLWFVEGLAEYMSIGSVDAHTAMWMRDAVLNDDVPSIDDLNNPKYFPYRYGQAFWAFLTGLKGDQIIEPFFTAVAKYGFEQAAIQVLGMNKQNLSSLWVGAIKNHFGSFVGDKKENLIGKSLINNKNSGRLNISPAISPNGRYVIFLSEKGLFSTDLYLADARNGKIIRKVASSAKSGHIDDFSYIESAGSWSPKSKKFVFVAVSKGKNILVIKEALSGKTVDEITIPGVPAFSNPAWSPDGKTIVVTGLVDGQVDLYAYNLRSKKVEQLTNDRYSEMHPSWSNDGKTLLFSSDQLSMEQGRTNGKWNFNLAQMDIASKEKRIIEVFNGADNLNPVQDTAGNILFLSNRDGFRNIYKYEPSTQKVYQLTDVITGISGITHYSPAISIARKRDRLVYSHFLKNNYSIHLARPKDFLNKEVDPKEVNFTAAKLPRVNKQAPNIVDRQLSSMDRQDPIPQDALSTKAYKSKFKLDYIGGSAGIGVGTSSTFGTTTGLAGGVDLLFSDILGNNQFFTSLFLNGEVTDFGGVLGYINRKGRINWGGSISHVPYRSSRLVGAQQITDENGNVFDNFTFDVTRVFEDKASIFAQLPFSKVLRAEAGASFTRFSSRIDRLDNFYDIFGRLIGQEREKQNAPPGFNLMNVNAAIVGDNSSFGLTAPLNGYRFRLGAEQYFGNFNFTAITADYRIYRFFKPVGFAFRAFHYGRYGGDSDQLFPLYIGSPWYIRGYSSGATQDIFAQNGRSFDDLLGSKIFVSNFEVRIPFTGPKQLSAISSKFLFTDLNFFIDGGIAWNDFDQFGSNNDSGRQNVKPIFSAGASVRVNLFGALILEPYYAIPIQKNTRGVFGLNIIPGW